MIAGGVGDEQAGGDTRPRRQPLQVGRFDVSGAGSDGLLIEREVLQKISFVGMGELSLSEAATGVGTEGLASGASMGC